jgi:hypothetical protein
VTSTAGAPNRKWVADLTYVRHPGRVRPRRVRHRLLLPVHRRLFTGHPHPHRPALGRARDGAVAPPRARRRAGAPQRRRRPIRFKQSGAPPTRSSSPPSSGSTGSTTAACTPPAATSHPPSSKPGIPPSPQHEFPVIRLYRTQDTPQPLQKPGRFTGSAMTTSGPAHASRRPTARSSGSTSPRTSPGSTSRTVYGDSLNRRGSTTPSSVNSSRTRLMNSIWAAPSAWRRGSR